MRTFMVCLSLLLALAALPGGTAAYPGDSLAQSLYCSGATPAPAEAEVAATPSRSGTYAANLELVLSQEALDAFRCYGADSVIVEFVVTGFRLDGDIGYSVATGSGLKSAADVVSYDGGTIFARSYGIDINAMWAEEWYGVDLSLWNVYPVVAHPRVSAYWIVASWEPFGSQRCDELVVADNGETMCSIEFEWHRIARDTF